MNNVQKAAKALVAAGVGEWTKPSPASDGYKLAGEQRDIVVTINHSLDEYSIEFIQQIEKAD